MGIRPHRAFIFYNFVKFKFLGIHAKFHSRRYNESSLPGEKLQNRPLNNLNTGVCTTGILPVKRLDDRRVAGITAIGVYINCVLIQLCLKKDSRHFWATVCKKVRPMLSDRCPVLSCPSCLSVCL